MNIFGHQFGHAVVVFFGADGFLAGAAIDFFLQMNGLPMKGPGPGDMCWPKKAYGRNAKGGCKVSRA